MASHVRALNEMAARVAETAREHRAEVEKLRVDASVEKLSAERQMELRERAEADRDRLAGDLRREMKHHGETAAERGRLAEALREMLDSAGENGKWLRIARAALEGSAE